MFLNDPVELTWSRKANKTDRDHLQATIWREMLDVKTAVVETGRPFTLVCSKTEARYEAALAHYEQDLEDIAQLERLER